MKITDCRACGGALNQFLDLGEQYISDFRADDKRPPIYPLRAALCADCCLVQLTENVPQKLMYHENYGFKSGISDSIRKDLDEIVTEAFQWVPDPKYWLDIASNDGTLLSYVPKDVYRVGIDPVKFLCEEAKPHADMIINGYFGSHLWGSSDGRDVTPQYDVVTSISCFYDMPDPSLFVADVKAVLAPRGVWIIQQNYLLTTLELNAVDNFCHEHLEYYTLYSLEKLLERFDLEIVDLSTSMVNGGSIRTVVAHKGTFPVQDSVERQRSIEVDADVTNPKIYDQFAAEVWDNLKRLKGLVEHYVYDLHQQVYILAASTRGATIWQAAGIGKGLVSAAVERNPAKVGKLFSAINIPIISEEQAHKDNPYAMIVGPWFFSSEIIAREQDYLKAGGKLIVPLPELDIVDGTS